MNTIKMTNKNGYNNLTAKDVIRELPFSVSKDVISVLDKVFFISNK